MSNIAAIRTHRWTDEEERLLAQLRPVFGERIVVVFHNPPADLALPVPVVPLTDTWVHEQGLRYLSDYGWRCGDYFLYALRAARPEFDHYWLIEPDVWFSQDPAPLFARAAEEAADLLAVRLEPMHSQHRFSRGASMGTITEHWKSIFCFNRFSGRAIDALLPQRVAYSQTSIAPRLFANDEVFCMSLIVADSELTHQNLSDIAPEWFTPIRLAGDPDILLDFAIASSPGPAVVHPVRNLHAFRDAILKRIEGQLGFLLKMEGSLKSMPTHHRAALVRDAMKTVARAVRRAGR